MIFSDCTISGVDTIFFWRGWFMFNAPPTYSVLQTNFTIIISTWETIICLLTNFLTYLLVKRWVLEIKQIRKKSHRRLKLSYVPASTHV